MGSVAEKKLRCVADPPVRLPNYTYTCLVSILILRSIDLWVRKCVKNIALFVATPRAFAPAVPATFTRANFKCLAKHLHSSI